MTVFEIFYFSEPKFVSFFLCLVDLPKLHFKIRLFMGRYKLASISVPHNSANICVAFDRVHLFQVSEEWNYIFWAGRQQTIQVTEISDLMLEFRALTMWTLCVITPDCNHVVLLAAWNQLISAKRNFQNLAAMTHNCLHQWLSRSNIMQWNLVVAWTNSNKIR